MLDFRNKKILIFGLGSYPEGSGVSAAKFFVRHGARVTVTDKKTARELGKTVSMLRGKVLFRLGEHRLSDVRSADFVIRNPGVPNDSLYLKEARRRGIPVMTDISIFMQLCPCSVLGITGTRGKSTTTALLGEMVRKVNRKTFVGGNIQRSPLTFLDKLDEDSIVVLELSSWLLESFADIRYSPWGAIITNIYPDHLNMHRSMREYVEAKANIFRFQRSGDIAVFNYDDPTTRRLGRHFHTLEHGSGEVRWFSMRPLPVKLVGAFFKKGWIVLRHKSPGHGWHEHRLLEVRKMVLRGDHNVANALATCVLARAVGVKQKDVREVLRKFRGLPNRQEIVRVRRGVTWVNDTTATSPEAVIAALERFCAGHPERPKKVEEFRGISTRASLGRNDKRIILIAGGTDKNFRPAQFAMLARAMRKYCNAIILLPGTATDTLSKRLRTTYYVLRTAKTMREAVRRAQQVAERGDIVVLSPGAASFGLFKNEFDRGEQFVKLVRAL